MASEKKEVVLVVRGSAPGTVVSNIRASNHTNCVGNPRKMGGRSKLGRGGGGDSSSI